MYRHGRAEALQAGGTDVLGVWPAAGPVYTAPVLCVVRDVDSCTWCRPFRCAANASSDTWIQSIRVSGSDRECVVLRAGMACRMAQGSEHWPFGLVGVFTALDTLLADSSSPMACILWTCHHKTDREAPGVSPE